jgi:hypothetical protein
LKPYIRIWEGPDGYHPIEPDSKYDDEERIHHTVVFNYEGVLYPTGAREDPDGIVGDILMSKFFKVRVRGVSTLRARAWAAIAPYLIFIAIGIIIVIFIFVAGPTVIQVAK